MTEESSEWEGRVAFMTGASSGIGLGIAEAFLDAGIRVALGYRTEEPLEAALRRLQRFGDRVAPVHIDVTRRESIAEATHEALGTFERIHVLVNDAGVQDADPISEMSYAQWDRVMRANLDGVFAGIHEVLRHIRSHDERGHVLTTASIASLFTSGPRYGAYSASKFAVLAMTESLAAELQGSRIGVSAICPGPVRSNLEPHHADFEAAADPLDIGRIALSGMDRGDLYILTHPEFMPALEARTRRIVTSVRPEVVVSEPRQRLAEEAFAYMDRSFTKSDRGTSNGSRP